MVIQTVVQKFLLEILALQLRFIRSAPGEKSFGTHAQTLL